MGKALIALVFALALVPVAAADTHQTLRVFVDDPPSAGVAEFIWTSHSGSDHLSRLRVFAAKRRSADVLPGPLATAFGSDPGVTPLPAHSRLLVAGDAKQVFAYPTKQGGICYFLWPQRNGACTETWDGGALPHVERGFVWGIVDNATTRVDVRLPASGWLHARLGRNGFILGLPDDIRAPTQIVVRERSGANHVYTIKRCRVSRPLC
jgi:hypothetical protein